MDQHKNKKHKQRKFSLFVRAVANIQKNLDQALSLVNDADEDDILYALMLLQANKGLYWSQQTLYNNVVERAEQLGIRRTRKAL